MKNEAFHWQDVRSDHHFRERFDFELPADWISKDLISFNWFVATRTRLFLANCQKSLGFKTETAETRKLITAALKGKTD